MRATRGVTRTILSSVSPRQPIEAMQAPRPSSSTNRIAGLRIPSFAARFPVERDLRARFPDGMLAPRRRSVPGGHAPPALRASIPRTLKCQSQPQTTARAFLEMLLTIPAASGRTSMNEAETTAGMGRRCRPSFARARGRASAHARRGGARACAHMRAPARTRARARG